MLQTRVVVCIKKGCRHAGLCTWNEIAATHLPSLGAQMELC